MSDFPRGSKACPRSAFAFRARYRPHSRLAFQKQNARQRVECWGRGGVEGRGTVTATFHIPPETIEGIRARADAGEKIEPVFTADVVDEQGEVVAKVEKRLYVRKKK